MLKALLLAAATSALVATSAAAQAPADDTTCFAYSMFSFYEVERMGLSRTDTSPEEHAEALLSVYADADPVAAATLVFNLQGLTIAGKVNALDLSSACTEHATSVYEIRTEELRRDLDQ